MKLLILSADEENSVVDALREAAGQRGVDCVTADPITVGAAGSGELSNPWQQRMPRLFGAAYRHARVLERTGIPAPYLTNAAFAKKLNDFLAEGGFDAVLCCDRFSTEAMLDVRSRVGCELPCYTLLTDYAGLPAKLGAALDGYFIPHEDLAQTLLDEGVPSERIYPTGVPVERRFGLRRGKDAARSTLAIPRGHKVYLVMADGLRFGEVTALCDALQGAEADDCSIFVLAERKSPLRPALERRYAGGGSVRIVTRPRRIELYLQCADVVLLSPDGVDSTEAAVAGVPLVHMLADREAARETARFFSEREMSLSCRSVADAARKARRLVEQTAEAARMIRRQEQDAGTDAADRILDRLIRGNT